MCVFTVKPNKSLNSIEEIRKLNKIGFTIGVGYLFKAKEFGFYNKIITNYDSIDNAKQLNNGVLDAWFSGTLNAKNQWKELRYDANLLQCGIQLMSQQISIAASLHSDNEFVEKISGAMEKYKSTDKFRKLLEKYSVTYKPFVESD